jgi:DinB superfamily
MISFSVRLLNAIAAEEPRLSGISEQSAGAKPANKWSKKQELGHLIDSAVNNRVRFMKAALEGSYTGPGYDQDGWVELGGYGEMPWTGLIDLWKLSNEALAGPISRIPKERLSAPCQVGKDPQVTLEFLIGDYILHMQHHLDHILSRDHITAYPGAALGA